MAKWTVLGALGFTLVFSIMALAEEGLRAPTGVRAKEGTEAEPYTKTGWAKEVIQEKTGMEMVFIPAGAFKMGSERGDRDEQPVHRVRITRAFYVGKYEVAVAQYRQFVQATGHKTQAEKEGGGGYDAKGAFLDKANFSWQSPGFAQTDDHPVVCMAWNDAKAFCGWLNATDTTRPEGWSYRLPTEAEWEYVARGSESLTYPWGNEWNGIRCNFKDKSSGVRHADPKVDDGHPRTAPVGTYSRRGNSPFDVADMVGNAWEWCEDYYAPQFYATSSHDDPRNTEVVDTRTARGGSWGNEPLECRSALRIGFKYSFRYNGIGFRVVLARPRRSEPRELRLAWSATDRFAAYCVAWGDFDNDGDPDLAVGNKWGTKHYQEPGKCQLYRNDEGKLVLAWTAAEVGATECDDLDWGDFDGDGDPDLAVGNDGGHPTRVYENKDGQLSLAWTSPDTDRTCGVDWGDWDGDGDLDLAVANQDQPNRIYRNDGGKFVAAWSSTEMDNSNIAAWADWDGDGDLDLGIGNGARQQSRVYENRDGQLVLAWSSLMSDATCGMAWGDWDGDGDPDLAVANEAEPNYVYENQGGRLVLVWHSQEKENTRSLAWGDWDRDGDLDLAAGNEGQPNRIYENVCGNLVVAWTSAEKDHTICVAWADVDGDGFLDLACGNKGPNRVYRNVVAGQALGAPRIPEEAHAALKTSNPNYNERGKFEVEDGQIVEADLANTGVANLAALKGLPLRMLNLRLCRGVRDLSPLKGAPLKHLVIQGTPVANLAPLKGMPLESIDITECGSLRDISALKGLPITKINLHSCPFLRSIDALAGMKLTALNVEGCARLCDISAVKGMPLEYLHVGRTMVGDLAPVKGLPLRQVHLDDSKVTDLTPLAGAPLEQLYFTPRNITKGIDVVRSLKTIKQIGPWEQRLPPAEFWKKYDAGEFGKPVTVGIDWECVTKKAQFLPRERFAVAAFKDRIWVVGGAEDGDRNRMDDVWHSADGKQWVAATPEADFPPRRNHAVVAFRDKLWLIAGKDDRLKNDVWCSADGAKWTHIVDNASFPPRSCHTCVVMNERIWLIGGEDERGLVFSDVWSSPDGVTWENATRKAPFPPRSSHTSVVFDGKLWVIGGEDRLKVTMNDVWHSEDGVDWTKATTSAAFGPRKTHISVVHKDRLWVLGGSQAGARGSDRVYLNDVWCSEDGVEWHLASGSPGFSARDFHSAIAFNDHIWVIAGWDVRGVPLNDVWRGN